MRRRTRLFVLGDWETPVFDSDTSDQPPTDFLLYGPHRELMVVVDIGEGPNAWRHRWSGTWHQTSRRKYTESSFADMLNYLTWPEIQLPRPVVPAPTEEERRRSLRYQPISEFLADVLVDADLTITVNRDDLLAAMEAGQQERAAIDAARRQFINGG